MNKQQTSVTGNRHILFRNSYPDSGDENDRLLSATFNTITFFHSI